jgi:putative endonuclease
VTLARQRLGRDAEEAVARRLQRQGFRLLARNARSRFGEIDLIALEGRTLAFIEVKAGRAGAMAGPERPVLAVDGRKRRRLRRLATAWLAETRYLPDFAELRFDVVGVSVGADGRMLEIEHIRAAF